jgi:hypothetical protein
MPYWASWNLRLGWLIFLCLVLAPLFNTSAIATPTNPFIEFLHLPLIQGYRPLPAPNIFGGEIIPGTDHIVAPLARDAGISWTRYVELEWSKVEPTPGERNWSALAGLETALAARSAAGLTNILVIGDTPVWARQEPARACSLIKADALDEFATFMEDLTRRYSRPPYYLNYLEIYNEPDVDPIYASDTQNFGCWGDETDANYGGGYFSQMLTAIYPRIKAANPNAQVIIGGLLLGCDPTHTYPEGRDCAASKFLRGILQEGNGTNFDAVAYHGYPLHSLNRTDWEVNYYLWAHRGGVVLGKLEFIREEMAAFNIDKKIFLTEGALLCYEGASCNLDQTLLRQDQANYVVRLYSRAIANEIDSVIWYAVNDPGWRYAGMLDSQSNPLPAYNALAFMTGQLRNATFIGTLGDGVNSVEGYAFNANNREVRIYWSNTATPYLVSIPAGASLYDKVGNPLPFPTTGVLTVGFEPIYVVLP